ncbi:MAG: protein kinase [Candidatus Sumerlaeota bacterium]|nr:protein kinase [Candidatus Sumerlaeota bacterium]
MASQDKAFPSGSKCSGCGAEIAGLSVSGLCPQCQLRLVQPGGGTAETLAMHRPSAPSTASSAAGLIARPVAFPQPGEQFGHYQIIRMLGQGGMGAVYEAEDLESGRRIALKVLSRALDSEDTRKRFFREGRLAASINHPNSIYVFGTEEIGGIPAIAMELAPGGTLRDRVEAQGPAPVPQAVDGILQIIAGLEAAQQIGILHRDVKPTNCFIDSNGAIKIGDFGLSISTSERAESNLTVAGSFLGTPSCAPPEQLRGDELTVRSDLYSVGVTLYYLLTGRMPFEAAHMVQLVAAVLERRPDSPAQLRPGIPRGLCRAVLRCLEKNPDQRFGSYAELRKALLPYTSVAPTPATLGLRFIAGCLDNLLLISSPYIIIFCGYGGMGKLADPKEYSGLKPMLFSLIYLAIVLLYFAILEGLWGASVGKAICGLRVVSSDRGMPGMPRATLRALIYFCLPQAPGYAISLLGTEWTVQHLSAVMYIGLAPWIISALIFCTMRRRNGFAAAHDLATRTRVILKSAYLARPIWQAGQEAAPEIVPALQIGPYGILGKLSEFHGAELLLGFDQRLLRKVWIRKLAPGAPPLAPALRNLGRPGRLRWLNGKRSDVEAWDAYEATSGQPLLRLIAKPQSWRDVRYWLLDMAEEFEAAFRDGSMPEALRLDRVWIAAEGRAKLLDFAAPGATAMAGATQASDASDASDRSDASDEAKRLGTARAFLYLVAKSALEGRAGGNEEARNAAIYTPIALHARSFMDALKTAPSIAEAIAQLQSLLGKTPAISRARRLGLLTCCMAVPILSLLMLLAGMAITNSLFIPSPDSMDLNACLSALEETNSKISAGQTEKAREREALEIYIAGRFRLFISDAATWSNPKVMNHISPQRRLCAEKIIAERTLVPPKDFEAAKVIVEGQTNKASFGPGFTLIVPQARLNIKPRKTEAAPDVDHATSAMQARTDAMETTPTIASGASRATGVMPAKPSSWAMAFRSFGRLFELLERFLMIGLLTAWISMLFWVTVPCFLTSLLFRGGVFVRLLGIAVVTRDGKPASRWRVFLRNLIAWAPFVLAVPIITALAAALGTQSPFRLAMAYVALLLAMTIFSAWLPERSLPDRLAKTWLVPR